MNDNDFDLDQKPSLAWLECIELSKVLRSKRFLQKLTLTLTINLTQLNPDAMSYVYFDVGIFK